MNNTFSLLYFPESRGQVVISIYRIGLFDATPTRRDSPQNGQVLGRTFRKLLIIPLKPTVLLFPIDQDSWPRNSKWPG